MPAVLRLTAEALLAATLALWVHEHGHLLAARSLGLRVAALGLGGGRPWLRWRLGGIEYSLAARFWAFGTLRYRGEAGGTGRQAWLVAAGALANAAAALLALPWAGCPGSALLALRPLSPAEIWVLWNLAVGAVSLLPAVRRDGHPSDGLLLWRLVTGRR